MLMRDGRTVSITLPWRDSSRRFALSPSVIRIGSRVAVGALLAANVVLMIVAWHGLLFGANPPPDWQGLAIAANRIASGIDPYVAQEFAFRWSPVAAWILVPFASAGLIVWQVLHVAALIVLPRRLMLAALACFAFWVDVAMGNVLVFGFVLAYFALSGRRSGAVAFTVFALLVPRPLYIPILLWLWLRESQHRRFMVGAAVVVGALTLATGHAGSWLEILLRSGQDIVNTTNMAPSRLIGYAWVPIGICGAVWAFRRGWVGVASLFASPYWLPYYFVMVLLDLRDRRSEPRPA